MKGDSLDEIFHDRDAGCAGGLMVSSAEHEIGKPSASSLHSVSRFWEKYESISSYPRYRLNSKENWALLLWLAANLGEGKL